MTYVQSYIKALTEEAKDLVKSKEAFERGLGRGMLLAIEKIEKGERLDRLNRRVERSIEQNHKNKQDPMGDEQN